MEKNQIKTNKIITTNVIAKEYSDFSSAFPVGVIIMQCAASCLLPPASPSAEPWRDQSLPATCYSRLPSRGKSSCHNGLVETYFQCCHWSSPILAFCCTVVWQMRLSKATMRRGTLLCLLSHAVCSCELTLVLSSLLLFAPSVLSRLRLLSQ